MNNKEKNAYLLLIQYLRSQEEKLKADAKEMVETFKKEIENQKKEQEKIEMMRNHPELFETTSPKQYGMNLKKNRKKK